MINLLDNQFTPFAQELTELFFAHEDKLGKPKSLLNFQDLIELTKDKPNLQPTLLLLSQSSTAHYFKKKYNLSYEVFNTNETIDISDYINLNTPYYKELWIYTWGLDPQTHKDLFVHQTMANVLTLVRSDSKQLFLDHGFSFLSISSAYRSPAYQLIVLCKHIAEKHCTLADAFQTIAPPFCSKHNLPFPPVDLPLFFIKPQWPFVTAEQVYESQLWNEFVIVWKKHGLLISYPRGTINGWRGEPWEFITQETNNYIQNT